MTKQLASTTRPPRFGFLVLGIVVGGLVSLGALLAMILIAWEKVRTGRGWETYRTHWLVEFNWVGFLVLLGGVGLALCWGLHSRLKEWRELAELERKYGEERHG
jgi:hypothetical protein